MDYLTANASRAGLLDEHIALIRAEGADADSFLQGQLSNDLRKLVPSQAQLSSYNSPKGRMLAVLTLSRDDAGISLELPRSLAEPILKRLRMFVLRAKLSLQLSDDSLLGLRGPAAEACLQAAGLAIPAGTLGCTQQQDIRVIRRHGDSPRFSLQGPREKLLSLLKSWSTIDALQSGDWALDDLRAGLPLVLPETQDHFVAQMANMDWLDGIAFDKGCYTGQEIVARLHYLGQLKRRMFWAQGQGAAPAAGSPVHDGDDDQSAGEVVSAVATGPDRFEANIVLQLSHSESTRLRIGDCRLDTLRAYRDDTQS